MTADEPPTVRGFFASVVLFRDKLVAWDLAFAMVAAAAVYLFVPDPQVKPALSALTGAGLAVATTLIGVVIAALAVVVAFLNDEFIALIDRATRDREGGMEGQLFPFWFVSGLVSARSYCRSAYWRSRVQLLCG